MIPINTDAPLYHLPLATGSLIALNTILFFALPESLTAPENVELAAAGLKSSYPSYTLVLQYGVLKPWQWLTSIFIHADFFHLLFNMLFLWAFGLVVEGKVGSRAFALIYLAIGVGQSGLEQLLMLMADSGASIGASAAVFGILGVAVVWAPRNEFTIVFMLGFYATSFEIPILMYGFIQFALEFINLALGRFSVSSAFLHLMGLGLGLAVGWLWLKKDWVDCEGWDLATVLAGREGQRTTPDKVDVDLEAEKLVRNSLATTSASPSQNRSTSTKSRTRRRPKEPASAAETAALQQQRAHELFEENMHGALSEGNLAVALKLLSKQQAAGHPNPLSQPLLFNLIRLLLAQRLYADAVPFMQEHIQRFTHGREKVQLTMARTLLHLEKPRRCLKLLKEISASSHSSQQQISHLKQVARRQIDNGAVEFQD